MDIFHILTKITTKMFKLHYNKQTLEDILIQRAVKTTKQTLYEKG